MKFLFVMDELHTINRVRNTTYAMMETSQNHQHKVYYCLAEHIGYDNEQVMVSARELKITRNKNDLAEVLSTLYISLSFFDAIIIRKDPPFNDLYWYATLLIERGISSSRIFNAPSGLRAANEKLYILNFPQVIPPTIVSSQISKIEEFLSQHQDIIIKPINGFSGSGIFRIKFGDTNIRPLMEILSQKNTIQVMAQKYIPEVKYGDRRMIVLDGKPLGVFARIASEQDHRSNIGAGGHAIKSILTERDRYICDTIRPKLLSDGLSFVGVDIIGDYLTEINVTSPSGVHELKTLSGVDATSAFIEFVEKKIVIDLEYSLREKH